MIPAEHTGPPALRVVRIVAPADLSAEATSLLQRGYRLGLVAGHDDHQSLRVVYLFLAGSPDRRVELHVNLPTDNPHLPSLASLSYPAGRFERELHDLFGIIPDGHPLPRRLVRHAHWPAGWYPMRHNATSPPPFTNSESYPFLEVAGDGVYEIPVGPVHAGLIEPGHFRFSVVGESIVKMKARLWFVHRGIERLFEERAYQDGVELAERISGDTSAAHTLAYCLAMEDALGVRVPVPVHRLRALLVELERLYNHATDLGALANDVGYSLANSHAQRIREQLLRINHNVTGHRLLRSAITPGGVMLRALPDPRQLRLIAEDLAEITELTLANSIVRDRFADTATLALNQARDLGCLGYVARASGLAVDARVDHPSLVLPITPTAVTSGDVLARYIARRDEFADSIALATHLIEAADGQLTGSGPKQDGSPQPGRDIPVRSGVGIAEGWRGTIVHRVEIDPAGRITRVKIVDPSWFNWPALPAALADTIVPDFPLVNKSFNLSYAGNDL